MSKILLFHPFLHSVGGAEYVLSVLANKVFHNADILAISGSEEVINILGIDSARVKFLLPQIINKVYRQLFFLYPALVESLDTSVYKLVVSTSYGYTHGLITSPDSYHICYMYTPQRALWSEYHSTIRQIKNPAIRFVVENILNLQRYWDVVAAKRPDKVITISKEVQSRIKRFYGYDTSIIYPPVDVAKFLSGNNQIEKGDYYITVSRLVKYKRIDLIVNAFKTLKKPLKIVGEGPEYTRLKQLVGGECKNIEFTGYVSEDEKIGLLQGAKGFIFAAREDFGISVVEAQASGTPVLAYKGGGTLETVNEKVGHFFKKQTENSLIRAFYEFEKSINNGFYRVDDLINNANRFSQDKFIKKMCENNQYLQ